MGKERSKKKEGIMQPKHQSHFEILIRRACDADAEQIVRLVRQLGDDSDIDETYVHYYLSGRDRDVLLAEQQCHVLGLLSYSVRADLYHVGNSVLIEELVVEQEHRGEGLGSALMKAFLELLPALDCKEVCLAVMPGNEGAIRFYKRYGLVEEALFLERHFT